MYVCVGGYVYFVVFLLFVVCIHVFNGYLKILFGLVSITGISAELEGMEVAHNYV